MSVLLVYVTCANASEADKIARGVVEARLAACANILPPHQSVYWWGAEIQQSTEVALILKTRTKLFDELERAIQSLHSYDVPCIVALPVERGHGPFLEWIQQETGG